MSNIKVALIACSNGLGHARRLLHVGKAWSNEADITLFATSKQFNYLENEISITRAFKKKFNFVEINPIGLQGPQFENSSDEYEVIESTVLKNLDASDFVFSDNALWPLAYRPDTIFLGHFAWLDYYEDKINSGKKISAKYKSFLNTEAKLLDSLKSAVLLEDFAFGKVLDIERIKRIKLPEYTKGNKLPETIQGTAIVSIGRTGVSSIDMQLLNQKYPNYSLILAQTQDIDFTIGLPALVIGRPGLGTLRDCVELGLDFSPLHEMDFELNNNLNVLAKHSQYDKASNTYSQMDKCLIEKIPQLGEVLLALNLLN